MIFLALLILALVLHLALGWEWGLAAGAIAGWSWPSGGWWRAALVVALAWAVLLVYSVTDAPGPTRELHRVLGDLAGGVPPWAVPAIVILTGAMIGLAGGLIGYNLRRTIRPAHA